MFGKGKHQVGASLEQQKRGAGTKGRIILTAAELILLLIKSTMDRNKNPDEEDGNPLDDMIEW